MFKLYLLMEYLTTVAQCFCYLHVKAFVSNMKAYNGKYGCATYKIVLYIHTLQVMGFKGVPVLVGHPAFDIIVKGTVIYYLHCVLLGVEIIRRPPRSPKERKHWKGDR